MKELKYLNKFFFKYRYRLIIGILTTVIARIFSLFTPRLINKSLTTVEEYSNGTITDLALVKNDLLFNILMIIGAVIISGFFTFVMRQTIIVMSRYIEFDLKNEIFQQYEKLTQRFYKKNRTGDLMNRISEDVNKVRMYVGPAIMYSINTFTLFVVVITNMFRIDSTLTLYTLLPLPILSVLIYTLSRIINNRSRVVQESLSNLTTQAQEVFSGLNIIKAYGIEKQSFQKFDSLAVISKEKNIGLVKANALFFPMMVLLIGISNMLVIYIGGMRYINGQIESIGVIAEFIIYVNMLTWPVAVVGWVTSMVQQAEASQKRINEFLKEEPEVANTAKENSIIHGNIEFKDVTFTYNDTNITALKNINFSIKQGQTLAILGKTGSGKSTILNLIARIYDIDSGQVLIDKKPIANLHLDDLRSSIGFVPQEAFLFSDTIGNNIKFGDPNATQEVIIKAAKNAHIHHNIAEFNEQYDTKVGERGVTLSGGQKQRISIARAIISNPEILIFDDCLSAVDTETEEIILNNLELVSKGKTTIIVSHRVSSAKNADLILVLEDGKIIQKGTHDQLSSESGYYQDIYNQQLTEQAS